MHDYTTSIDVANAPTKTTEPTVADQIEKVLELYLGPKSGKSRIAAALLREFDVKPAPTKVLEVKDKDLKAFRNLRIRAMSNKASLKSMLANKHDYPAYQLTLVAADLVQITEELITASYLITDAQRS